EADGLYVVVGGRLRFESVDERGVKRSGDFGRGEIIGELALLTGDSRSATVRAVRDSELVKLSDVSVQRMLHEAPHALFWLTRILAERLTRDQAEPVRRFSVLTVLPVSSGVDMNAFCTGLKESLSFHGNVELMTPQRVDEKFGPGTASLEMEDPRASEFMIWLSDIEHAVDYLLLQGSTDMSWNERCIRQADKILLVADAGQDPRLAPVELKYPPDAEHVSGERNLVLIQPADALRAHNTKDFLANRGNMRHFHVRRNSSADFQRLARGLTGNSIGLVLGGGGARGMAHIGVLKALIEHQVPIDMVGGTSAGAIMAGTFAFFQDLERVSITVREFMVDRNPLNDYTFPFLSLARGRKYSEALERVFGNVSLEDLLLPAFAIACNLSTSQEACLKSGAIWTALRATSSLPGIAPPLFMDGQLFVDGGLLNNLPVDAMQDFGAGKIIAIDVSSNAQHEDEEYGKFMGAQTASVGPSFFRVLANKLRPRARRYKLPSLASVLIRSTMIGSVKRVRNARREADIYARLPLGGFGLLDWKAMDDLIKIGYDYAVENMPLWKKSLGLSD
ncbi:MAG TPA: cyclic nucleotide-binding and patatin-like phospholipase domain-containing protein, partial [Leptospiraceae bacterium]|nr:cyclic nucleotide-binding and patatin-like phospholipase domain-containing protein [Leptospiraceae bacterium]